MKKRLGSILLEEGLIDKAQLEDALKIQRERGGRLGSILIQLGYIDADTLAKILKEQLNIETVNPEDIEHLDYETINAIPRDLIEEYMVLPVKVRDGEIEIAMLDPKNTQAISELSFFLDKEVIPLIIPEGLLYKALKKYYNIEIEPEEEIVEEVVIPSGSPSYPPPPPPTLFETSSPGPTPSAPKSRPQTSEAGIGEKKFEPPVDVASPSLQQPPSSESTEKEQVQPLVIEEVEEVEEVIEEPIDQKSPISKGSEKINENLQVHNVPVRRKEESVVDEWIPTPPPIDINEDQILKARNIDDLAYILARVLAVRAKRSVIFKVLKNTAFGWVGKGDNILPSTIDVLMVPLCAPSIFKTADETGETFFGPPPLDDPVVERVLKAFEAYINPPENVILTPVKVRSKTVLFLYLDNGPGKNFEDLKILPEINRIAETAAEAVEKIIANRKHRGN